MDYITQHKVIEIVEEKNRESIDEIKRYFGILLEDMDRKMELVIERLEGLIESHKKLKMSNERLSEKIDIIHSGLIKCISNKNIRKRTSKKGNK